VLLILFPAAIVTTITSFFIILILSIKPDLYSSVINQIKDQIKNDVIVVTIAAGL
jgi:pyrroline-5-carboxylate reductase